MNRNFSSWLRRAQCSAFAKTSQQPGKAAQFLLAFAVFGVAQAVAPNAAHATRYFYQIDPGQNFLGVIYENDLAYGGGGRSRFQVNFASESMTLIADDVTGTLTLSGQAAGSYFAPGSDPSNLGGIPQAIGGSYQVQAHYVNVQVGDPDSGVRNPIVVSGAGTGDGYFQKLGGNPFYASNDGRQYFWDMEFAGIPPLPNVQLANYSFALEAMGNDLFRFDGWIHSGLVAGLAPFYHGDFHGVARYLGSDAPPSAVPEPGTVALMLTGLAGLRAKRTKRASTRAEC